MPAPELLPSLRHLVRGLGILFWGLPVALVVGVETARGSLLRGLDIFPALAATAWLLVGLGELGKFQPQERVWAAVLFRVKWLGLVLVGLSPFLFWGSRVPLEVFFRQMTALFALVAVLQLAELNIVLRRLAAMLPDETLRDDVRLFSGVSRALLFLGVGAGAVGLALWRWPAPPQAVAVGLESAARLIYPGLVLFILLPLALTMALLWKTRQMILDSVFAAKH